MKRSASALILACVSSLQLAVALPADTSPRPRDVGNDDLIGMASPVSHAVADDDKKDTPSVDDIAKDIRSKVTRDESVFWTGGRGVATTAKAFAKSEGLITILDTDTDAGYSKPDKWKHWGDEVVPNWSEAYAQDTSGDAFVLFNNLDKIDPNQDSVWNQREFPTLTSSGNIYEIQQISAEETNQHVQIWPTDVRDIDTSKCVWQGKSPFCKPGECPAEMQQVARSHWGDGHICEEGEKILCCPEK